jgi:glyoxylate/hydroxypyruvate reductase A
MPASNAPVVLLSVAEPIRAEWMAALEQAAERSGIALSLTAAPEDHDPGAVEYLVFSHSGPVTDFAPYTGLTLIQNIWAGVEKVLAMPSLPAAVPFARMVESGMTLGMRDYVVAHVMRYHAEIDTVIHGIGDGWAAPVPPLACERCVGVLGLGTLGSTVAAALVALGFEVIGWSRTSKDVAGVETHAGAAGLSAVLARAEILVCLLPRTPATENLIDADRLARLPRGARIVNAGRGELIDDAALLAALDSGQVGHATLDVFRQEPLPPDHPLRRHPRLTVTPHIASVTRPGTAAETVIAQIRRGLAGEPFAHVVDRARGY